MSTEKTLYPSYAGLNRTAMQWGIPLLPGLAVFVASMFFSLAGAAFMGPGGFVLGLPGVPIIMYFKHVCATDDQALRITWFELMCVLRRKNASLFGKTYTLAPMRYGRSYRQIREQLARPLSLELQERFIARFKAELEEERLATEAEGVL
ncbi:TPA: VirB3 family type IV secretion system protein [Burkholderia cepacia ATCC 25416]|jgi:type IV secretion system protein VirB3|uniref:VirB3 family type IV secretion system protein n=2 Tax=Burkholderia cepacia complex TaxID=87882 RepID=A0AAP4RBV8_9BURK|nr:MULTISPECIES: VirB3 family type IV secretion system protein [Burkholderia]EJH9638654.1 VirB3 family type IV secretion system protein [Listeria monocytogenes]HDR9767733.1 VirB3 family type IV secretion system protein [Burkholderia cepacia ATCC 25416]ELK7725287.1 VirB3 family type IV secretion system protein [Burkholderia cenocepacia]MBA9834239.1 type IV secretion system protein VirB3 [Burkholderia contaminans]MBD1415161.1 VirB3 family type IV secretion system protein [Burkholderia contaminan